MKLLEQLEKSIRRKPRLYFFLRPIIPYLNILFPVEREFKALQFLRLDPASGAAIDVGFNDGLSSIAIKRYTNLKIVGFEPLNIPLNPLTHKMLRNVEVNRIGLGKANYSAIIFTPEFASHVMYPYSSLNIESAITNACRDLSISKKKIGIRESKIVVSTLDSFNYHASFVKIDTEGTELEVLLGARKTLDRCRPALMIEIADTTTFTKIQAFLKKYNYVAHTWSKNSLVEIYSLQPGVRNYWFIARPNEKFIQNSSKK